MQPREDRDPCRLGIVIVHRFGPCSVPGAPCVYRRRVGGAPGRAPGPSAVVAAASADRAARGVTIRGARTRGFAGIVTAASLENSMDSYDTVVYIRSTHATPPGGPGPGTNPGATRLWR